MINFNEDIDPEQEVDKIKVEIDKREHDTDKKIRKVLDVILRKNLESILPEEKAFLKARQSYLTKAQREEYADIINANYSNNVPVVPKLEDETRSTLEKKALELGIKDPDKLPNKNAVIEAIRKAQ